MLFMCLFPLLLVCLQLRCIFPHYDPDLKFSKDDVEEIDRVISTLYENGQFSGAVLVSVKGEVVYKRAVGYANLADGIPNTCDTKFRIASFTKPITAMLILQLAEDGLIELHGKLMEYLPEFAVEGGEKISIHHLLTHRAGIIGHPRIPNLLDIEKQHYTREELLALIMKYDLVYEPGRGREYSNFGFALLAMVIEKVTGRSYDEVMNDRICKPAGMTSTLSDVTEMPIAKRAVGYTYDYFNGLGEAPFLDMSFVLGAGQLISTVEDLYLFDRALYTDKLLSGRSKELFFNKYGWYRHRYPYGSGSKRIACRNLDGSINGFQSHTQRVEKDGVFIVALRNVKESVYENEIVIKWPNAIASPVLSILYDEDYEITKRSGAFAVFKALIESGAADAERTYAEITGRLQDDYYIDRGEFAFFLDLLRKKNMENQAEGYRELIK